MTKTNAFPRRIVCLTEESVEILYALGMGERIVGVSSYVKRPQAAQALPKVCTFIQAKIEKIVALKPDLVIGYCDLQADIAAQLIKQGLNVFIANHSSFDQILDYTMMLGSLVGKAEAACELVLQLKHKLEQLQKRSPWQGLKVYIEEWDQPYICGSHWLSDLVGFMGAEDVFADQARLKLGTQRQVTDQAVIAANPDIILASWCGKRVQLDQILGRAGWEQVSAIKQARVYELDPTIFLQPGLAPFTDGAQILENL